MSAQGVRDAGFPNVANLLDGTNEGTRIAWRELRRFKPATIGEAFALDRARQSMPMEDDSEDYEDDE